MHSSASTYAHTSTDHGVSSHPAATSRVQERRGGPIATAQDESPTLGAPGLLSAPGAVSRQVGSQPQLTVTARVPSDPRTATLCERYAADLRTMRVPARSTKGQRGRWHLAVNREPAAPTAGVVDIAAVLAAMAADLEAQPAAARYVDGSTVSVPTLLAFATVDLLAADRRTGQNVATSHETAAKLATTLTGRARPFSAKTADRARTVWQRLGWLVVVARGRRLTLQECQEARAAHGRQQMMAASTRDWIIPDELRSRSIVHQPSTAVDHGTYLSEPTPSRAAARPDAGTKKPERARPPSSTHGPRFPIDTQRFAGELAHRLPWLDRGHVGRICGAVRAAGIDTARWTVPDLMHALEHVNRELGRDQLPAGRMRDPLAWFVDAARFAVRLLEASGEPLPSERRRAAEQERDERIVAWHAQERALAAERAAVDVAARDRALEAYKQLFPPSAAALKRAAARKKSRH